MNSAHSLDIGHHLLSWLWWWWWWWWWLDLFRTMLCLTDSCKHQGWSQIQEKMDNTTLPNGCLHHIGRKKNRMDHLESVPLQLDKPHSLDISLEVLLLF